MKVFVSIASSVISGLFFFFPVVSFSKAKHLLRLFIVVLNHNPENVDQVNELIY